MSAYGCGDPLIGPCVSWPRFVAVSNERERFRVALEKIQQWDMLNPPQSAVLSDAQWLRDLVDAALGAES